MKAIYTVPGYLFLLVIYRTQAHDISKRATADNDFYVLAKRDGGCVPVDSIEPCPVTWTLSAIAAKFYNQQTRLTNVSLNGLGVLSASNECKDAFKTTMCGQAAPKCLADGSQDYNAYGDVATACAKIYSECPKNVSELFKSQKLCDKVFSGKKAKPTCVTPPKIEGSCPQPKYKMPTDALYLYNRSSADNTTVEILRQVQATPNCTSDVKEMQCVAIYCSKEEKYLLTEFTNADCENTTKHCLIDPIEALIEAAPSLEMALRPTIESLEETCAVYPAAGSKKVEVEPTSKPTSKPTSSGNIQLVDCVALLFSFIVVKLFA